MSFAAVVFLMLSTFSLEDHNVSLKDSKLLKDLTIFDMDDVHIQQDMISIVWEGI